MTRHAIVIAIFVLLGSITAVAQEAELSGTAGEIRMIPKKSGGLSGSLGLSFSQSDGVLSGMGGNRYMGSLGGQLAEDRLWFFASAEQQTMRIGPAMSEGYANTNAIDARVMANLGDRQSLAAIFAQGRSPAPATGAGITTPSSFLSMRYTGIVSDTMFFNASFSRREATQPVILLSPNAGQ